MPGRGFAMQNRALYKENTLDIENFLEGIRQDAFNNHIPVMRDKTIALLEESVRKKQPDTILEIGTSIGTSGIKALSVCKGILTTIEIDEDTQETARKNFQKCNLHERCNLILGDCKEVLFLIKENKYDFIILDGPKSHYAKLYEMIAPMLNIGGILFVDDVTYYNRLKINGVIRKKHRTIENGLKKFWETVTKDEKMKYTFYEIEDGVLTAERIK